MSRDLLKDGVPSSMKVEPTVLVTIKRPQAPGRMFADDGTVSAFLEWCRTEGVYPIKGTGASGPGFHTGVYSDEDADKITNWSLAWFAFRLGRREKVRFPNE